jgi:two-component system, sensor histidine kinase
MDHEPRSEAGQDLPPRPLEGLRLLAVEDHAIGRILLEAMLGPLGVDATVVADGAAARDAARTGNFAVVLVDLGLPDVPGERLAGELARLPGCRDAAIVAVTGRARPDELPPVFVDWLEKPFSVRELDARLRALIDRRALSA